MRLWLLWRPCGSRSLTPWLDCVCRCATCPPGGCARTARRPTRSWETQTAAGAIRGALSHPSSVAWLHTCTASHISLTICPQRQAHACCLCMHRAGGIRSLWRSCIGGPVGRLRKLLRGPTVVLLAARCLSISLPCIQPRWNNRNDGQCSRGDLFPSSRSFYCTSYGRSFTRRAIFASALPCGLCPLRIPPVPVATGVHGATHASARRSQPRLLARGRRALSRQRQAGASACDGRGAFAAVCRQRGWVGG
jgi:hypothetical protein